MPSSLSGGRDLQRMMGQVLVVGHQHERDEHNGERLAGGGPFRIAQRYISTLGSIGYDVN